MPTFIKFISYDSIGVKMSYSQQIAKILDSIVPPQLTQDWMKLILSDVREYVENKEFPEHLPEPLKFEVEHPYANDPNPSNRFYYAIYSLDGVDIMFKVTPEIDKIEEISAVSPSIFGIKTIVPASEIKESFEQIGIYLPTVFEIRSFNRSLRVK